MSSETVTRAATRTRRLTVRQVAEEWQLFPGTIRRAIRGGELPAVRVGSGYRLLAEDVEEWIEGKWGE